MTNQTILALDVATVTGFAVGAPGKDPIHGSVSLRSGAEHPGTKGCLLGDWIGPILTVHKPWRVVIEAPLMMMPKSGGNAATMEHLIGLPYLVKVICCRRDIPVYPVASSTVRKFFLGNGRPENPKKAVMDECRRRGWEPSDDNDADSCAVWDYACGLYFPDQYRRTYR